MRHRTLLQVVLAVVPVLVAGFAAAQSNYLEHGRVSYDTGALLVKSPQDTEWAAAAVNALVVPGDTLWVDQEGSAEVEMAGASFLRLADQSKAEVVSLPPDVFIRGWIGSFYVQRLARSEGTFVLTAPAATVEVATDSMVRLDINEKGALTVSVRWGRAVVNTDQGGDVTAMEGTRVWVDPGYLPSDPTPFDRAEGDAFDGWSNERARMLAESAQTTPKEVVVENTTVGIYDLPRYGEWVYVDHRPCWRPTIVTDYIPYRYGYWNYMPTYGHVWVDEYPFAYVTSHYGRWRHTVSYGWVWSYDPVWSPAWVASMRVGDYYMWSPVDFYYRPVLVTGAATFGLGGLTFSTFGCSYAYSTRLYSGPGFILGPERGWVDSIIVLPPNHINAWHISPHHQFRPPVPFDGRLIAGARDYNPPRSIRGIPGDIGRSFSPVDRARRLERALGRSSFATARPEMRNPARTAALGSGRMASTRPVRLNQTEQTYLRAAGSGGRAADRVASLVPESQRLGRSPGLSPARRSQEGIRSLPQGSLTPRSGEPAPSVRSGRSPVSAPPAPAASPRNTIAVRDLESSAPAPQGSGQIQRTPSGQGASLRSGSSGISRVPRTNIAPNAGVTPRSSVRTPSSSLPSLRSTPAPSPQIQQPSNSGVRTAPGTSLRRQPGAPSSSLRSVPGPASRAPDISTPSLRSSSGLSNRGPSVSVSPSMRAPSGLSSRAPNMSMPSLRSSSGLSSRGPAMSMPSMRAPSDLSSRAPGMSLRGGGGGGIRMPSGGRGRGR